ncbi:uncharacterized protein LOC133791336 [Humulus lupulus]|uniref:uncharacterized protein LOC133791336 n=1 Tax=Humulus lupulus TaxID=3486 RepID=UPI002B40445C|nr:uncharacterized protein LOC133791336 [Humulus lupulus]XP_062085250.1 uncharacterized protein LOC133791336 [Humulus lupulus]XP_062085252.1 uncharacterized protein LOC133791336 [Humulus lupulus]XP_062085257.1 uncharacterized protein LOC133791336 [Humulus lupulus]XP_062085263.1 uncharacterized protein LOC133791336 [Humulus lupulus]XP_062085268.1 uncharacterized protein LOC133791336 [Humulus lupulus]XP_062085271.1 uncharacterized protein LOC133791336 [Humulus lupulus]
MEPSPSEDLEDYGPSSTLIGFDRPLPLLRGPVSVGPHDDASAGSFVLAFRDPRTWANAYRVCESKIIDQCVSGARIGCSISASSKCKPPWWRALTGFRASDLKEREQCEEREMKGCLEVAKEKCSGFAKERCLKSFRDARVVARDINAKQVQRLVCLVTLGDKSTWVGLIGFNQLVYNREFGTRYYRASELLGSCSDIDCILGGISGKETSQ